MTTNSIYYVVSYIFKQKIISIEYIWIKKGPIQTIRLLS